MMHILEKVRRRIDGDEGFTLVEAMVSITILAVGAFTIAQAMIFGLGSTGLSRQRLASRAALDQQMEEARALNYDNLVLSDSSNLTHSTNPNNPDYWVDQTAQTYDPDGSGPLSPEPIVRVAGASPALSHYQNPYTNGGTTYEVYRYVTWYDSPQDGLGVNDAADGNNNGVSDANGHDAKRVTVVVVWINNVTHQSAQLSESSLFSDGQINYKAPTHNTAPTVSCPLSSVNDKTVTFDAVATDSDGTIASVSWDFGDGTTGTGSSVTHTYSSYGTYTIVNTVVDNGGSTANNSSSTCHISTTNPTAGNGGPNGTITVNGGAVYANSTSVTLTLAKSGGGPNPATMKLSNDGTTWLGPFAFSTSYPWTLTSGDGTKTVYVRFYDSSGLYGNVVNDTIILDTTPPGPPTAFHKISSVTSGAFTTATLGWTAPLGVSDLGGYRMYARLITSTGAWSLICDTSSTSCSYKHKKTDTYEFYVVAYDLATNVSANSATPNPTG
ncbi:MAG TPA: PKD domain-containing protein [Actinomycetota bacterium]|jgi:type II secretory pathway pseudopilin PulG|nr:PKD domain-containing protein [Actinomycetota bacterium]